MTAAEAVAHTGGVQQLQAGIVSASCPSAFAAPQCALPQVCMPETCWTCQWLRASDEGLLPYVAVEDTRRCTYLIECERLHINVVVATLWARVSYGDSD